MQRLSSQLRKSFKTSSCYLAARELGVGKSIKSDAIQFHQRGLLSYTRNYPSSKKAPFFPSASIYTRWFSSGPNAEYPNIIGSVDPFSDVGETTAESLNISVGDCFDWAVDTFSDVVVPVGGPLGRVAIALYLSRSLYRFFNGSSPFSTNSYWLWVVNAPIFCFITVPAAIDILKIVAPTCVAPSFVNYCIIIPLTTVIIEICIGIVFAVSVCNTKPVPFSVDGTMTTIKTRLKVPVLGEVLLGRYTTLLLTAGMRHHYLPNFLLSRLEFFRSFVRTIPLKSDDRYMSSISNEITRMLIYNPSVCCTMVFPYCYNSLKRGSYLELTLGCDLIYTDKEAEKVILSCAGGIIKGFGGELLNERQQGGSS